MKKTNLIITGCMGRMGQQIIKSVKKNKDFKIVALTENKKIVKMINGINVSLNTEEAFRKAHLIIDFTTPKCTFQVLKIASKLKKRVVIGTTGFSKREENLIKKFSKKIPILKAGNMSLGINLLMKKTNLVITGCMGRMGQQIIKSVKKDKNFRLIAVTENRKINKKINGIKIYFFIIRKHFLI